MQHWFTRAAAGLALAALIGCGETKTGGPTSPAKTPKRAITMTMGLMPRAAGTTYAEACKRGAEEAGRELGVKVVFDGPKEPNVVKQAEIVDSWIDRRLDAIAAAPEAPHPLAPYMSKAMRKDIKVLTWDTDGDPGSREVFVNPATYQGIGFALVDALAADTGGKGDVAILTSSPATTTESLWIEEMRKRIAANCPEMNIAAVEAPGDEHAAAYEKAKAMLFKKNDLTGEKQLQFKGIACLTPVALVAGAKAVFDSELAGKVAVTGVASPKQAETFVKNGTVRTVVMWNAVDLGYLTVQVAKRLFDDGQLPEEFDAGRLGKVRCAASIVLLGPPLRITKANIDDFDF